MLLRPQHAGIYLMNTLTQDEKKSDSPRGERWWKSAENGGDRDLRPVEGAPCPKCLLGDLSFDTLFRLQCSNCGYIAECGAFT